MLFGDSIWPRNPNLPQPALGQEPFFIFESAFEALSFSIGVAFAIFGWRRVSEVMNNRRRAMAVYVSIVWLFISWWPHGKLHQFIYADNILGLLLIEYGFHLSVIVVTAFVVCELLYYREDTQTSRL